MSSFAAEEDALLEEAARATGLEDFGPDEFREGFRTLLEALDESAPLSPLGRLALRHMILRDLGSRLVAERGFREHPESAAQPVERPLVIVGLPRTGTTALQELLALDPALQGIELWLARAPKPRPPRERWPEDPDWQACDRSIRLIGEHQPELLAIHEMDASKVDECWNLLAQSFTHSSWMAQTRVEAYRAWFLACDKLPAYRRHRRNLQLIGARQPGIRWLLKDSTHLFALDALLEVHPDACVVQTHRDPVEAIPSVCSLCWAARKGLNEGESPAAFGRETLELWHGALERSLDVRAKRPAGQFFDVSFRRFREDPLAVIEEIHRHFGIPLGDEARARMARHRAERPPRPLGAHATRLEDWSLGAGEIRERFARYTDAHEVG